MELEIQGLLDNQPENAAGGSPELEGVAVTSRRRSQPTISETNTSSLASDDGPNELGRSHEEVRSSHAADPGGSGSQAPAAPRPITDVTRVVLVDIPQMVQLRRRDVRLGPPELL